MHLSLSFSFISQSQSQLLSYLFHRCQNEVDVLTQSHTHSNDVMIIAVLNSYTLCKPSKYAGADGDLKALGTSKPHCFASVFFPIMHRGFCLQHLTKCHICTTAHVNLLNHRNICLGLFEAY